LSLAAIIAVALRCPNHPIALAILSGIKIGIAAPSANRYGKLSPTSAQHVFEEFFPIKDNFSNDYDLIIPEAGNCEVGIESTIIDMTRIDSQGIMILRPGMISANDIANKTGLTIGKAKDTKVAYSGSHMAHYAPMTPMYLMNQPLKQVDINEHENSIWLSIEAEDFNHSF
jgi:L-threonylcarbamoyladenylate synthase